MHIRCDQYITQRSVDCFRKSEIGMSKVGKKQRYDSIEQIIGDGDPKQENRYQGSDTTSDSVTAMSQSLCSI
jgi:hypothetical protein